METEKIMEIKSDLINELIGLCVSRGVYDTEYETYRLSIYRGYEKVYVSALFHNDTDYGLVPVEGYNKGEVLALVYHKKGNALFVIPFEDGSCPDDASAFSVDDLCKIRDFINGLSDDDLVECNNWENNWDYDI